jgi:pyruvate-formate lyase-activating enzyme
MKKNCDIVIDFKDKEVRKKSKGNVPVFFREWESVGKEFYLRPLKWSRQPRRPNMLGYPPFDIFSDWIMDFATISAGQLGRNDWQNYRKMLLLHFSNCPLFCWYCFNDAWEGSGVRTGKIPAVKIVDEFLTYRKQSIGIFGEEVNILRISGGEPFCGPETIEDIANVFKEKAGKETFLWVDTNLVPISKESEGPIQSALKAIADLNNRSAIHACIHGADQESFYRNTLAKISSEKIIKSINNILEHEINLYLRLNPIGLDPNEIESKI